MLFGDIREQCLLLEEADPDEDLFEEPKAKKAKKPDFRKAQAKVPAQMSKQSGQQQPSQSTPQNQIYIPPPPPPQFQVPQQQFSSQQVLPNFHVEPQHQFNQPQAVQYSNQQQQQFPGRQQFNHMDRNPGPKGRGAHQRGGKKRGHYRQ